MKKTGKLIFKILGIVFMLILVAGFIIPIFYKKEIMQKVKDEANKNLNAKVDFGDFGLTLFKSFPDFSISIENVCISGVKEFEGDTLIKARTIYAKVDLWSVFKGDKYEIKTIELDHPKIYLKVLKGGKANWDITKLSTDTIKKKEPEKPSTFKMGLHGVFINNADITYDDKDMDMLVALKNMNFTLKGDFTSDFTSLETTTTIDKFDLKYGGVKYMNKIKVDLKANLDADLKNSKYTFKENELKLNEFILGFDGYFAMPKVGYDMDLKFNAKKTEFKNLLSLIPGCYTSDFENVKTTGKLAFGGFAKGLYTDTHYPAFELNLDVDNAMFQYPSLPKAVTNIFVKAKVNNKGGSTDNTVIDVPKLHLVMGQNPIDARIHVSTPVSDPAIDAVVKGKIKLGEVKDYYPLEEGAKLSGLLDMDIALNGRMSYIDQKKYDLFKASGKLAISDLLYNSKSLPQQVTISNALLNFTPQHIALDNFSCRLGKSDISAKGTIDNLLSYIFKDEELHGNFNTNSNFIDLNEFMSSTEPAPSATKTPDTSKMSVIEIPGKLDFTLNAKFSKILYEKLEMTNVNGIILLKDKVLGLEKLFINALDGDLILSGKYDTKEIKKPLVDFNINMNGINIQKAFKTFNTIQKLAPIMEHCFGKISIGIKLNTLLDQTMMPVYKNMTAFGTLNTKSISVTNAPTLNMIADALKIDMFRKAALNNINLNFKINNGKLEVEPFTIKMGNTTGKVQGTTSLDQSINYVLNLEIPTSELGPQANAAMNGLVAQANKKTGADMSIGKTAKVDILIGGTFAKPTIKTGMKGAMNDAIEDLKNKGKEELDKQKAELEKKGKEEADKLKKEGEEKLKQEKDKLQQDADKAKKDAEDKAKKELEKQKKDAKDKADKEAKDKLKGLFK